MSNKRSWRSTETLEKTKCLVIYVCLFNSRFIWRIYVAYIAQLDERQATTGFYVVEEPRWNKKGCSMQSQALRQDIGSGWFNFLDNLNYFLGESNYLHGELRDKISS